MCARVRVRDVRGIGSFGKPVPPVPAWPRAGLQMSTSTWLRDHLIAAGHLTETGLSRRAKIRACSCKTLILAGLDSDICALEASCDPQPLSALGEALAHLEHRRTFTLRRDGKGWVLDWRDAHHIAGSPATSQPRSDVVREHRCGTPPPAGALTAPSTFPEIAPPPPAHAAPPF